MAIPEHKVSEQERVTLEKAEIMARAQDRIQAALVQGEVTAADDGTGRKVRAFVAPVEKNTKYLVKKGDVVLKKNPASPDGEGAAHRKGDVYVEFIDSICVLDEAEPDFEVKLEWCESHPKICRNITDPFTEAWAYFKGLQVETAYQDRRLPQNVDIERLLAGDASGNAVKHSAVERARQRAAVLQEN